MPILLKRISFAIHPVAVTADKPFMCSVMTPKVILAILFSIYYFLFTSAPAVAAQDITISPSSQQITLQNGSADTHTVVEVKNSTNSSYTMHLAARDFGTLDQSGGVAFLGDKDPDKYRLASWISVAQQLELPAGAKVDVPVVINNDNSLAPGGHYAAVILTFEPPDQTDTNVAVHQSMAALLMVTKQGGATYGVKLEDWQVKHSLLGQPQSAQLTFSATGNSQVVPRGTIEIRDPFGKLIGKGVVNDQSREVLPDKPQTVLSSMQFSAAPLWPGWYASEASYRYDGSTDFKISQGGYFAVGLALPIGLPIVLLIGFVLWRLRPGINRQFHRRK